MDTTVILAQPRGSRLRAAVVYVDRSGLPRAQPGEPDPYIGANRTGNLDPPDPGFISVNLLHKNPLEMRGVCLRNVKQSSTAPQKRETVVNWTSET